MEEVEYVGLVTGFVIFLFSVITAKEKTSKIVVFYIWITEEISPNLFLEMCEGEKV